MTTRPPNNGPLKNHLLATLTEAEYKRLRPDLSYVSFALGDVLHEPGEQMSYVYFPTTAIVSLLYTMDSGASAEIGIVGNDGLIGLALFLGGETTPSRAVVQSAGSAYRMPSEILKREFKRGGELQLLMLRYMQALLAQISQTAVCNCLHSLEQQLCRWLLISLDHLHSNELVMTQELIANMLGVRREGVTRVAGQLQREKVGSSRVDLQACKLEYSIVSPK